MWYWWITYLLIVICIVFLAVILSYFINALDKRTKVPSAMLSAILLGAVTSIPELITTITTVLVIQDGQVAVGNILGSNIFNVFALCVVLLFFITAIRRNKYDVSDFYTLIGTTIATVFVLIACSNPEIMNVNNYNFFTLFILIVYIVVIYLISKGKKNVPQAMTADESKHFIYKMKTSKILSLFAVCAVILIGASVGLTYVTDIITKDLNMPQSSVGAIFLGLATSLPEVVATIALCRMKNFNAAISEIAGSNMFNLAIIFVADIAFVNGDIFTSSFNIILLASLCVASSIILGSFLAFHLYYKKAKVNIKLNTFVSATALTLVAGCYISYIVMSFI